MRWSKEQLQEYITKFHKPVHDWDDDTPDEGKESVLQRKIEAWCREWGRPCLSFRQSKHAKHLLPAGWPDITLILPGQVLFIELKAAHGRLSPEQQQTKLQFMALGHKIHEIRSFKRFLEVVKDESIRS